MKKKGQGLSLNVIIVAAIALVVMIVIIVIFLGRINIFGKGLESCSQRGGSCTGTKNPTTMQVNCPSGVPVLNTDCEPGAICCISLG